MKHTLIFGLLVVSMALLGAAPNNGTGGGGGGGGPEVDPVFIGQKGIANGVATLDPSGDVPAGQLDNAPGGTPATALPIGSDDAVGAVGVDTDYAREDHKHPVQHSSNTPSTAAGDVAAVFVDAAIAELASEKLATTANNDAADDLSDDSIDALSDVDTTTAAPTSGQALKWNGSAWAPAADATGAGGTPEYFRMGTNESSSSYSYNPTTWTMIDSASAGWSLTGVGFTGDVGGAGRGITTYDSTGPKTFVCHFGLSRPYGGAGDAGEGVYLGLSVNGADPVERERVGMSIEPSGAFGPSVHGTAVLTLSATDTVQLAALGYVGESGSVIPEQLYYGCVEPGATGLTGPAGADGADGVSPTLNVHNLTTNTTLSIAQMDGDVITNEGATGPITITMGAQQCVPDRDHFSILHMVAETITIDPFATTDAITTKGGAAGQAYTSDGALTTSLTCVCVVATKWGCAFSGPWN